MVKPNSKNKIPLVLSVDDDPSHNIIVSAVLKKFGVQAQVTASSADFLGALKTASPDLCLIDLNIEQPGVGFSIIKAVRKVLGSELPIIVVSGLADHAAITHAMEVGANDFVTKPIDKDIFAAKLNRFLKTDALLDTRKSLLPVPEGGAVASIEMPVRVLEIDELGIKILSAHILPKGSALHLDGTLIHEVCGSAQAQLLSVTSTWLNTDGKSYVAFLEFDQTKADLMASVRRWLTTKH